MASVTETFTTDANPIGGNWNTWGAGAVTFYAFQKISGVGRGVNGQDNGSYYNGTAPANDHYCEGKFPSVGGTGYSAAYGVRHDGTCSCYLLEHYGTGARLRWVDAGSFSTLGSAVSDTRSASALYRCDATGTTISGTKDGGAFDGGSLSQTDSNETAGVWCFYAWNNYDAATNYMNIDDLYGSDGAGGGSPSAESGYIENGITQTYRPRPFAPGRGR